MAFKYGKALEETFAEGETRTLTFEGNRALFTIHSSIMTIVYFSLESASSALFSATELGPTSLVLAPFVAPFLHLYFDLFSGVIQTLVFVMLSLINIYQEQGEEEPAKIVENVQYQR